MLKSIFKKIRTEVKTCDAVGFIRQFARESKRSKTMRGRWKNYARHLETFSQSRGIRLMSDEFSYAMAEDFVDYLKDLNLMQSTVSHVFRGVKLMFRRMGKAGWAVNQSFEDVNVPTEQSQEIYLNPDELKKIRDLPLKRENVKVIRDLFLIGCYMGFRHSDYSKLTKDNIAGKHIVRKTRKTGEVVQVPIHPVVRAILDSRNGEFPKPRDTIQNFNGAVKNICKRAGIADEILWERTVGKKIIRRRMKKYELVSSHTTRRSFATNAYLAGVSPARIMLITGHRSEESLFNYIRIAKEENANFLAEHPFFS